MSGDDNYTIETTDSGASETVSVEAGQIRKGGYIMVKGKYLLNLHNNLKM